MRHSGIRLKRPPLSGRQFSQKVSHKYCIAKKPKPIMEMSNKTNTNTRHDRTILSPLSRFGWLSLILAFASRATAFNSRSQLAMLGSRTRVRDTSTDSYGSPKTTNSRQEILSTRLQYRDGNEDPFSARSLVSYRWWNSLFSSTKSSGGPAAVDTTEQDTVDDYLEFLDRRYRRLHDEDEKEEPKPFSALNWLLQGDDEKIIASQQQQEDALYVLGVAGLASQKLLQKHPHIPSNNNRPAIQEASSPVIDALDALDASVEESTSLGHIMVRKFLVPFVKLLYFIERRKQMFVNVQMKRARGLIKSAARSSVRALVYGPKNVGNAILEIGGGKRNVVSTFAFATSVVLLAQPVLQAIITESSVNP